MKKYVRKVTRVGERSLAIVIPAELVKALKLRERQKLTVHQRGTELILKDWKG